MSYLLKGLSELKIVVNVVFIFVFHFFPTHAHVGVVGSLYITEALIPRDLSFLFITAGFSKKLAGERYGILRYS